MGRKAKTETVANAVVETEYTKAAIIGSKKFENRRDLLNALLEDGKYTIAEVERALNTYLNKEV